MSDISYKEQEGEETKGHTITSDDCVVEESEWGCSLPEPVMMPVRYSQWEGFTPQQIEDQLSQESVGLDRNGVLENQIEILESLCVGLDFWGGAVDIFKARQTELALMIDYTGRGFKHERRGLETILKECHSEISKRRQSD